MKASRETRPLSGVEPIAAELFEALSEALEKEGFGQATISLTADPNEYQIDIRSGAHDNTAEALVISGFLEEPNPLHSGYRFFLGPWHLVTFNTEDETVKEAVRLLSNNDSSTVPAQCAEARVNR